LELRFKKSFIKELKRMPDYIKDEVKVLIEILEKSESLAQSGIEYKFLEGQNRDEKYLRFKIGGYRIGAEFVDPNIIIITIGSRGDFYKTFP
jgi:mRNA interferase RelE/StbE